MSRLFWMSGGAWAAIEPHLPKNQPGTRRVDDRRVISGIFHVLTYMKALRTSVMSLYEVSEILPGRSFQARDLIRGGEPVAVSEGTATSGLLWPAWKQR